MNKMSISFPSGGVLYISVKYLKQGGGGQKWEVKAEALNINKKEGKEEEKTLCHEQRKVFLANKQKTEK